MELNCGRFSIPGMSPVGRAGIRPKPNPSPGSKLGQAMAEVVKWKPFNADPVTPVVNNATD